MTQGPVDGGGGARRDRIIEADRAHVWHPYTPMAEYHARGPALVVERARGARLVDVDGREVLDGNASWWTAALGHNHPRLIAALRAQSERLCHVALAGVTHEPAALLAEELCAVAPAGLSRVFFSDDGSTAIEVAAKMAVQYFRQAGRPGKSRLVALEGAFHGETIGAASLGGVAVFRQAFGSMLFDVVRVRVPGAAARHGAATDDFIDFPGEGEATAWRSAEATDGTIEGTIDGAIESGLNGIEAVLAARADEIAAVFVEPIVQGAAGMRMYAPRYLSSLRALCDRHEVLLVADEVFTGYGRTGTMWGCDHAGVAPDLMCVGKGFTGGVLPMAATLASERVFAGFLGGRERAFLHGHSFTGNPLGAAVAREVLSVFRDEDVLGQAARNGEKLAALTRALDAEVAGRLGPGRTRRLGMIAACDLGVGGYLGGIGWRVYEEALARGALVRPLGDTVYLTPPLNIDADDLDRLCSITLSSVRAALGAR